MFACHAFSCIQDMITGRLAEWIDAEEGNKVTIKNRAVK